MNFPTINDYSFKYQQLSQIDWRIIAKTKDNVNMSLDIRCGPNRPQDTQIFELLKNPDSRKQFVIELEEIKEVKPVPEIKVDKPVEKVENTISVTESGVKFVQIPSGEINNNETLVFES